MSKKPRYSAADLALMAEMWDNGATKAQIADRLGRSTQSIVSKLVQLRLSGDPRFPPREPSLKAEQTNLLVKAAVEQAGLSASLDELARLSGRSPVGVWIALRRLGLSRPGRRKHELERKICRLAEAGMTNREIAAELAMKELSVTQVASRARKHGIRVPYQRERVRPPGTSGEQS